MTQLDPQRRLVPEDKRLLIVPVFAFFTEFYLKVPKYTCENRANHEISQAVWLINKGHRGSSNDDKEAGCNLLFPDTVSRTDMKRLYAG